MWVTFPFCLTEFENACWGWTSGQTIREIDVQQRRCTCVYGSVHVYGSVCTSLWVSVCMVPSSDITAAVTAATSLWLPCDWRPDNLPRSLPSTLIALVLLLIWNPLYLLPLSTAPLPLSCFYPPFFLCFIISHTFLATSLFLLSDRLPLICCVGLPCHLSQALCTLPSFSLCFFLLYFLAFCLIACSHLSPPLICCVGLPCLPIMLSARLSLYGNAEWTREA